MPQLTKLNRVGDSLDPDVALEMRKSVGGSTTPQKRKKVDGDTVPIHITDDNDSETQFTNQDSKFS